MILMKISDDGELECNWEEIEQLAELYDDGQKNEDTHQAKLLTLIYLMGYAEGVRDVTEEGRNLFILMNHTGGNA